MLKFMGSQRVGRDSATEQHSSEPRHLLKLPARVLEKTLESPLDCKKVKSVNPKGNQPYYSLEELMLKPKLQYFGHLMQRVDSLEKILMLGKIQGRRRG